MRMRPTAVASLVGFLLAASAYGQADSPNPSQQQVPADRSDVPIYRVTVVARTTPAVNYRHRGGATKVDFRGTPLLPDAHGEAKVESKQGYIEIEVEFDELSPATRFGPEYLTYVMWAITPEGRATNLGEVLLKAVHQLQSTLRFFFGRKRMKIRKTCYTSNFLVKPRVVFHRA